MDPDPGQAFQIIPDQDSTLPGVVDHGDPDKTFQINPDPQLCPPPPRGGSGSPTSGLADYPGFAPESRARLKR